MKAKTKNKMATKCSRKWDSAYEPFGNRNYWNWKEYSHDI